MKCKVFRQSGELFLGYDAACRKINGLQWLCRGRIDGFFYTVGLSADVFMERLMITVCYISGMEVASKQGSTRNSIIHKFEEQLKEGWL
jgi:hypothetical protein